MRALPSARSRSRPELGLESTAARAKSAACNQGNTGQEGIVAPGQSPQPPDVPERNPGNLRTLHSERWYPRHSALLSDTHAWVIPRNRCSPREYPATREETAAERVGTTRARGSLRPSVPPARQWLRDSPRFVERGRLEPSGNRRAGQEGIPCPSRLLGPRNAEVRRWKT